MNFNNFLPKKINDKANKAMLNKIKAKREALGQTVIINQSEIKYSEFLLQFIQPFLTDNYDGDELFEMLDLGIIAWNTGNIKAAIPGILYEKTMEEMLAKDKKTKKEEVELFKKLVERKVKEFSMYEHFIEDFEMNEDENGMAHITVMCRL